MRTLLILGFFILCSCQKTKKVVQYYDEEKKNKQYEYYVLKEDTNSLHGKYIMFFENGAIQEKAKFKNNQVVGKRILYYPNGRIKIMESHKEGIFEGKYISYFESGNTKEEGMYINNEMSGIWKFYYDQNPPQVKEEVTFENNMENGPFREYHKNGKLAAEGSYFQELEHGETKVYDEEGKLIKKIMYNNGRPIEYTEY